MVRETTGRRYLSVFVKTTKTRFGSAAAGKTRANEARRLFVPHTHTHTLTRTIPIWYDLGKPIYINICASARPRERSSRYPRSVRPISRLVGWRSQSLTEESIGIAIGSTDVTTAERVSQALCNTQFRRSHYVLLARNNGWDAWKDLHCHVTYESGFRWNENLGHSAKWFAIYVGIENWRRNKEWPCSRLRSHVGRTRGSRFEFPS